MLPQTQRAIAYIKHKHTMSRVQALAEYMAEYTGKPVESYLSGSHYWLYVCCKDLFSDYLKTCNNPGLEFSSMMNYYERARDEVIVATYIENETDRFIESMVTVLELCQVKKTIGSKSTYTNGFTEEVEHPTFPGRTEKKSTWKKPDEEPIRVGSHTKTTLDHESDTSYIPKGVEVTVINIDDKSGYSIEIYPRGEQVRNIGWTI